MDDTVLAKHLENLDHRFEGVQQVLQHNVDPRLEGVESRLSSVESRLSSVDSRLSNVEQILPTLATTEALHTTEAKLRQEIREEGERARRHMTMLIEHQDTKLQLLAEHVLSLMQKRP